MATGNCSRKPEQKGLPIGMARMMGLETAAELLGGKVHLAAALDITTRSLAYKVDAGRGISNGDLRSAAFALEMRAARLAAHAAKLREEAGDVSEIHMEVR